MVISAQQIKTMCGGVNNMKYCNHCHRSSDQVDFFSVNWCMDCRDEWIVKKTGQKVMKNIEDKEDKEESENKLRSTFSD